MTTPHSDNEGRAGQVRPSADIAEGRPDLSDLRLVDVPGFVAFWCLAVIVFLQFFTRYVLNDSLAWTEEIARYVLILVAFFGAITVTRKGTHIFLEFFYRLIPAAAGKWLAVLMECISTFFYGYMAWVAVQLALKTKTKMASAEIPKSLLYWCVAASLAVMAVFSLIWLIRKLRQTPDQVIRDLQQRSFSDISD